jgi:hypothetical protein
MFFKIIYNDKFNYIPIVANWQIKQIKPTQETAWAQAKYNSEVKVMCNSKIERGKKISKFYIKTFIQTFQSN